MYHVDIDRVYADSFAIINNLSYVYQLSPPRCFGLPGLNCRGVVYGEFGDDRCKTLPTGLKKSLKWYLARKTDGSTGL